METPILTKSTPEGARDFLVPSRLQPGEFYALPQSPQLFKQLLMVAGFERYYQIARAFRDEDLRADRQPEHTQIDLEMSFIEEAGHPGPGRGHDGPRLPGDPGRRSCHCPSRASPYAEAMRRYGSDKPDMRFGMEIVDVVRPRRRSATFKVFADALAAGGAVRGLRVEGGGGFSRKDVDDLAQEAAVFGANGLAPVWVEETGVRSPIAKFLGEEDHGRTGLERWRAAPGTSCCSWPIVFPWWSRALGALRLSLADRMATQREGWAFLWVVDPPMFEYDERERRLKAQHHPFTKPRLASAADLPSSPLELGTYAYDLVLNGVELGSGSIRIADPALQEAVFQALGLGEEEIEAKFGFLVEAMDYGVPPHGGMALGLDRL